jgi:hypothetical protein
MAMLHKSGKKNRLITKLVHYLVLMNGTKREVYRYKRSCEDFKKLMEWRGIRK